MKLKTLLAMPAAASLALAPLAAQASSLLAQPAEAEGRSDSGASEEVQTAIAVFFVITAMVLIALSDDDEEEEDIGGGVPVTP